MVQSMLKENASVVIHHWSKRKDWKARTQGC